MYIRYCCALVAGLFFATANGHAEESVYIPKNLYLVKATTVEVGQREVAGSDRGGAPKSFIPEARFEVTHVYLGPDHLKKQSFKCETVPYQATVTNPLARHHINVSFEKGAEGLWWVKYDDTGKGSWLPVREAGYVDALGIRPFPYQKMLRDGNHYYPTLKAMAEGYQEGIEWAQAVAKVGTAANDQERAKLLQEYAAKPSPMAAWAIAWLALARDKAHVDFFRKLLADAKQPLESQVNLDRALVEIDAKNWEGSKERAALHKQWSDKHPGPVLPVPLEILKAQKRWSPPMTPFGLGFQPAPPLDESGEEYKRLQGKWRATSGTWAGKALTAEQAKACLLTFHPQPRPFIGDGGGGFGPRGLELHVPDQLVGFEYATNDKPETRYTTTWTGYSVGVELNTTPPTLTMSKSLGLKSTTFQGIYRLDKDALTVAFNLHHYEKAPKEFVSPARSKVLLLTLTREKGK